ncbi:DUF427 domain-containing protein [Glacieibacterium megasporae]|uniref:DUF427 domain-containing protein n=1 Tax=Glacieibacterium megasporae TaxID=2835787 RepID=UPI001C1E5709|nr:DUF427 domain-containing protein [Polymorphobacter megasporae]UAJ11239.1 DUF427 domain-containing protein [Polymorphobacter megasporae]
MVKAVWNDTVIAESNDTVVVENNHYFPIQSVAPGILSPTKTTSICPWKGTAEYHSVNAAGKTNVDAAWYYAEPKAAAAEIKGRVAFWKGVKVS